MLLQSAGRKLCLALVVQAAGELSFAYGPGRKRTPWAVRAILCLRFYNKVCNMPDSTDADRRFSGDDLGPLKNHSFMYFPIR
jgi:hypothetical protein